MGDLERYSLHGFIAGRGMRSIEREAAEEAIADARELWLPILEEWVAELTDAGDILLHVVLEYELRRLRRLLKLPPVRSPEQVGRRRADP